MLFLHSDAASLEGEEPSVSDQSSQGCIGEKPRVSTGMKPGYLDSVRFSRPGAIFGLNRAVVLLILHDCPCNICGYCQYIEVEDGDRGMQMLVFLKAIPVEIMLKWMECYIY